MIYLNVWLTVKDPNDIEKVSGLLAQQARMSRMEPGCVRFEVYHSQADAKVFMLNEHWDSQEAVDQHRLAQAYNTVYKPQVLPLVERVAHPSSFVCCD